MFVQDRAGGLRVVLKDRLDGLALFGVDDLGLDKVDRAILRAMCEQFNGGPVGLSTVAISVGEQPDTVEDVLRAGAARASERADDLLARVRDAAGLGPAR